MQGGIVDHAQEVGEDAGFIAGGEGAYRAIGAAELRLTAENVGADERGDHVGGGIRREQHRATIFLFYDGRLAQCYERVQSFARIGE